MAACHPLPEPVFEGIGHTFRVTFHGPGDDILDLIPEAGVTDRSAERSRRSLRELGLNERQIEALRPFDMNCTRSGDPWQVTALTGV